jgi:hypothetical protein
MEKKLLAPLTEITTGPRLQGGNSQRKASQVSYSLLNLNFLFFSFFSFFF